ncbi:MAG: hypothetical protein ACLP7W_00960 [Solirubrobacteraceae bacterium]
MRPNRLSRPRRIAVTTVTALSLLASGAVAYWSTPGEANASANLATLPSPTISTATPGAGTVELTWSAVTPPGGGTVEYFVTRDGGSPGGGCPSSGSPSTATSCTDTGVPIGTHAYTVTAVWRTWTATSTAKSATVAFGPTTHLVLEAASVTPTAGAADNLTITAKDASNNTVRTYTGAHSLIFEGAEESPNATKPVVIDRSGTARSFGEATEITFTEGKATVASAKNGVMKLYKAETADIVVEEGSLSNGAGLAVTVKAAATKKLTLSAPSEATAGSAFSVTLTATDEYGNPTTSYTGEKTLAWSGPASSPGGHAPEYPASATTVTFTNGVGTASEIDLYDAVATVTLTVKEGSAVKGSASIAVKAAAAKTLVFTALAEQTAGTAFNATLTAHDEYGNTATGYAGAKTLLWSGPSSSPSAQAPSYPATVTFSEGAGTASITLYDAQGTALVAKEGTLEGTSDTFTVKAAAAKKFIVPAPSEQEAGVAFNVTLTATDTWGNIAKSYTGNKTITWSGPASSPSGQAPSYTTTITFTEGAGAASAIKLYDAQSTALLAKQSSSVEGTSSSITVRAAAAERLAWSRPEVSAGSIKAGTCPFACVTASIGHSETFSAYVSVTDAWGNIVSNLGGATKAKVELTSGSGTLTNAAALAIPASGPAESSTIFEYTSPASGTSEAVLKLRVESGTVYTEAEAHVKY